MVCCPRPVVNEGEFVFYSQTIFWLNPAGVLRRIHNILSISKLRSNTPSKKTSRIVSRFSGKKRCTNRCMQLVAPREGKLLGVRGCKMCRLFIVSNLWKSSAKTAYQRTAPNQTSPLVLCFHVPFSARPLGARDKHERQLSST